MARVDTFSGYGQLSVQLTRGISKLGPHVQIRSVGASEPFGAKVPADIKERFVAGVQPEPWELLLHPPGFIPTPGKRVVIFTMWEATRLRPPHVTFLNMAEHVFTPSKWGASCFSASGVDRPIHIVPLGIDPEIFQYRRKNEHPKCLFGCAGRMAHGGVRKGINEVIDIFQKAFPDEEDVVLRVKCFPDCPVNQIKDTRIVIDQAFWSDQQMADWLATLTAFVSLAKLEGWGLLQHQALAVGRPVISAVYGGVAEFLSPQNSYPIDFKLVPAELSYAGCGHWAQPNEEHTIELMRQVYKNRNEAEAKGLIGSADAHRLTWANTCETAVKLLKEIGALD